MWSNIWNTDLVGLSLSWLLAHYFSPGWNTTIQWINIDILWKYSYSADDEAYSKSASQHLWIVTQFDTEVQITW